MKQDVLVGESSKHLSVLILVQESAFPRIRQDCGAVCTRAVTASSIEEDIRALSIVGEVADHKGRGVNCPELTLHIMMVFNKASKLHSLNLIGNINNPWLFGSLSQRTEFLVLLLYKPRYSLHIRHLKSGLVTDGQVAAGVGGIRQGVAILTNARGGGWTPCKADQVSPAHALALLLAAVKETLLLLVSGALEHASVKRETWLEDVRVICGWRADHRLAARIFRIWFELALRVDVLGDQLATRLTGDLQLGRTRARELAAVKPGLAWAVARVLSPEEEWQMSL